MRRPWYLSLAGVGLLTANLGAAPPGASGAGRAATAAPPPAATATAPSSGFLSAGPIDEAAPALRNFLALHLAGSRLLLDRSLWPVDITTTSRGKLDVSAFKGLEALGSKLRSTSVNSDSTGIGQTHGTSFTTITAQVVCGDDFVDISIWERAGAPRTISIREATDGSLRVLLTAGNCDVVLFNQTAQGAVSFTAVLKGQVTALAAASFAALLKTHAATLEGAFVQTLDHVGVAVRFSLFTPEVLSDVVAGLSPVADAISARAEALVEQLGSAQFAQREEASALLAVEFDTLATALRRRMEAGNLSPEAASRLKEILKQHPEGQRNFNLARSLELASDAGFLIAAIDRFPAGSRAAVYTQLRQLTGQNLSDDPAAWRDWWNKRRPVTSAAPILPPATQASAR